MKAPFEIRARLGKSALTTTNRDKREAAREMRRLMRQLGPGSRGDVRQRGFGFVVQERLRVVRGRLTFRSEEL